MPILIGILIVSSILSPMAQDSQILNNSLEKPSMQSLVSTAAAEEEYIDYSEPSPLGLDVEAVYAMDAKTGEPIVTFRENRKWSLASLTKIMTAMVYLDEKPDQTKVVELTQEDIIVGTKMGVPAGTKITAEDLLNVMLVYSGNDAANALIRGTNLSREQFIDKMNKKAVDLGLKKTRFVETSGSFHANVSSAEEFAKVTAKSMEYSDITRITRQHSYQVNPLNHPAFSVPNTNLIATDSLPYEFAGGKIGENSAGLHTMALKVKQGDNEAVVVILGSKSYGQMFANTKAVNNLVLNEMNKKSPKAVAQTEVLEIE